MKKKALHMAIFILALLLLFVVWMRACDHEDLEHYSRAEVSEITFEELISAPYVKEGVWSFVDMWRLYCRGDYSDPILGEEGLYQEIAAGLQTALAGETLYTYVPQEKVRDYDKHIEELLSGYGDDVPLFLQLSAGSLPPLEIAEGDVSPTLVRLYCLDEHRCYLTIGYRAEGDLESTHYVFYTEDPAVVEELFLLAQDILAKKKEVAP